MFLVLAMALSFFIGINASDPCGYMGESVDRQNPVYEIMHE